MAIVKSIDVALRANTEQFEEGLKGGAKTLDAFAGHANRVADRMGELARQFQLGAIGPQEYSKGLRECEQELKAMEHGFSGMGAATQRAQQILLGLETETDRYNKKVKELDALLKLDRLTHEKHAAAVAKLASEFRKGTPAVDNWKTRLASATSQFAPFLAAGGAAAVAHKAMASVSNLARLGFDRLRQSMADVDAAHKAAGAIGIATGELMKLRFAIGEVAGVGAEGVDMALKKMNMRIAEAATTGKGVSEVFTRIGLSATSLASMSPEKAFMTITDAISKLEGAGDRTLVTMRIFEESGLKMMPIFNGGSEALRNSAEFAQKFGLNLSQVDAIAIEQANDTIARMNTLLTGVSNQITAELAPQITALGSVIIDAFDDGGKSVDGMRKSFENLGRRIAQVMDIAGPLLSTMKFLNQYSAGGISSVGQVGKTVEGAKALTDYAEKLGFVGKYTEAYDKKLKETEAAQAEAAKKLKTPVVSTIFDESALSAADTFLEQAKKRQEQIDRGFSAPKLDMPRSMATDISVRPVVEKFEPPKFAPIDLTVRPAIDKFSLPAVSPVVVDIMPNLDPFAAVQSNIERIQSQLSGGMANGVNAIAAAQDRITATFVDANTAIQYANKLYAEQRIGLEQRNRLLEEANGKLHQANAAQQSLTLATSATIGGQAEFLQKVKEVNAQFEAGNISITERNELLRNAASVAAGASPSTFNTPAAAALETPIGLDMTPLITFQYRIQEIHNTLASNPFQLKFETEKAQAELTKSQDALEAFQEKRKAHAEATKAAEEALHSRRLSTLAELLGAQQEAWAAANPALAAQEELRRKVAEINDLYRADLITLAKRNELLSFVPTTIKTPGMDDATKSMDEAKRRAEEIAASVKNPFEKYADKLKEIRTLETRGLLDRVSAARAEMEARMTAVKEAGAAEIERARKIKEMTGPDSLERGSQQAFSAFQQASRDTSNADAQLAETKKTNQKFDTLIRRAVVLAAARL